MIPDEPEIAPFEQIIDECDAAIDALLEDENEYIRCVQEYYERKDSDDTTIRAHGSISSDLHAKAKSDPADHQVPDCYNKFASVFDAKEFDQLPPHREWDHKIELREGWQNDRKLRGKLYNLDHAERAEAREVHPREREDRTHPKDQTRRCTNCSTILLRQKEEQRTSSRFRITDASTRGRSKTYGLSRSSPKS